MQSIVNLPVEGSARLAQVEGNGGYRRRLLELGFLPGTLVRMVRRVAPAGLLELELRGCRVTLRAAEASRILVVSE